MKKKTVITTEKHEVWVIRQPEEVFGENSEHQESAARGESLSALIEQDPDQDVPEAQENH